ncbi:MAG: TonB-dependent receptor plug domain-containing protein, partial [Bacteroidaceae bacterium]|nr:TonB-dependent receptor plug domain-containing protein [Bacteroidaceae bacterium]
TLARLLDINPDDIESITVLKDGAATAIYGDKGKNGVIEIKVREETMTEQLIDKLPGAEKQEDGSITLNGKKVKRILVEGQEAYNKDDKALDSEGANADVQP